MTLNDLKNRYFPVLDYGFVAVKDYMGSDADIAEMARTSYKLGTKQVHDNVGLIRHLLRHRHTSPFERCELVLHCGMPIFVARQWVRHRTASLNEHSGRYSVMPLLFYTPTKERCCRQSQSNKQGSNSTLCFDGLQYQAYRDATIERRQEASAHYDANLKCDMARELARIDLPLSTYTYWYWKMDLHNLLHFLSLRLDHHAQWEIREYAKIIGGIVKLWCPISWAAFKDYQLNSVNFRRAELSLIREIMAKGNTGWDWEFVTTKGKELGLTQRELREFVEKWHMVDAEEQDCDLNIAYARDPEYYEQLVKDHAVEMR